MKGISSAMGKGAASRLGDDEVPGGRYVYECLPHARRPFDLDPADTGCAAQAKVHHGLARPRITDGCGQPVPLLASASDDVHSGTDPVAIAARTPQLQHDPMTGVSGHVVQHDRALVQARDYRVDPAGTVEIAKCGSAVEGFAGEDLRLESSVAAIQKNRVRLPGLPTRVEFGIILNIAVGRKDVLVAIVVEVEHAGTPTAPGQAARGKPAEQRHLRESAAPEITKQREGFVG